LYNCSINREASAGFQDMRADVDFSLISYRSLVGTTLRLPLRLIPSSARLPILQGPLRGKRWIVGSGTHGCWLGSYEFEKQKLFSTHIKPGYTVYDLGANVGFYSLLASVLAGPAGGVYSFEPVERNLQFLREHLNINRVTNCSVWDVAVGRSEGSATFDLGPNASSGHLTDASDGMTRVRVVALDALVCSGILPPPDLIKCDIEGAEYDALLGASEILAKHGPTIFLATHSSDVKQQCLTFLAGLKYRLTPIDERSLEETDEVLAIRPK
jgi:FkbM family methyltransferase